MKTNGREPCPFTDLTLPDGSPLKRISYRAMATGYPKTEQGCEYAFQYPVLKGRAELYGNDVPAQTGV